MQLADVKNTPHHISSGNTSESAACDYLEQQGLELLGKNYRSPFGEIDLIMKDSHHVVFVEVRYRKNHHFGTGAESVTYSKQKKISRTALHFLQKNHKLAKHNLRFDVVSVSTRKGMKEIDWIDNAFQPAAEIWP